MISSYELALLYSRVSLFDFPLSFRGVGISGVLLMRALWCDAGAYDVVGVKIGCSVDAGA